MFLILAAILVVGATVLSQHSYTPAEIEEGGRLFRTNCVICHGVNGNTIARAALGSGTFQRAKTDEDAARLIRTGIADAGMPPFEGSLTEPQAGMIAAYLRSLASATVGATSPAPGVTTDIAVLIGDAVRGKSVFEGKGNCLQCHQVGTIGARWGPDLSNIGAPRGTGGPGGRGAGARGAPAATARGGAAPGAAPQGPTPQQVDQLRRAILEPDAEVLDANRTFRAVTRDGRTITGRLLNLDTFSAQLIDTSDKLVSLEKDTLREFAVIPSPMPSYKDRLTEQELSDLLSYLVSLRQ
jgi:mono/diheme cytochrome c family protein